MLRTNTNLPYINKNQEVTMSFASSLSAGSVLICLLFLVSALQISRISASKEERLLIDKLLVNYSRFLRPKQEKGTGPTIVNVALHLEQIFELEEKKQVLASSAFVVQTWYDRRLEWNSSRYGGVKQVFFEPDEVWVPDLVLINNAAKLYSGRKLGMTSPIHVMSNGKVTWYSNVILKSYCKMKVRYFPFDEQFCPIHIASWSYIGTELIVADAGNRDRVLQNYTENSAWHLDEAYHVNSSRIDRNFPRIPKATVTYFFHLRRNVFYYFVYLFAPCMLTSLLMTMIFLAPPDCGERMVIGVTSLLALTVFFMLAAKNIPETSEDVPLMGRYYSASIVIMSIALVATSIVLRFHHCSSDMPRWVKIYILGYLAYFVKMKTPQNSGRKTGISCLPEQEIASSPRMDTNRTHSEELNPQSGLAMMADRVISEEKSARKLDEWRLAARVLDRFFLWLYIASIIISLLGIFMQIPGLVISRPVKPLSI